MSFELLVTMKHTQIIEDLCSGKMASSDFILNATADGKRDGFFYDLTDNLSLFFVHSDQHVRLGKVNEHVWAWLQGVLAPMGTELRKTPV